MMRGIAIFSFFAMATVLVIVLQPGPRADYAYQSNENALLETSRNEVRVLREPQVKPALQAPDEVISSLKAAVNSSNTPAAASVSNTSPRNLQRLQAALDASLRTEVAAEVVAAPTEQPAPQANLQVENPVQIPVQAVAPELRDMSWQTLNALNSLAHVSKAPGQEGSLLNSIVRRSMGRVGTSGAPQPSAVLAPVAVQVQRAVRTQISAKQTYVVSPGDTLALIAIKLYGSALATDHLLADNAALRQNPDALRIGQVLNYNLR